MTLEKSHTSVNLTEILMKVVHTKKFKFCATSLGLAKASPTFLAKTRVLINTYAIWREPKSWDEPFRYIGSHIDIKGQDFEPLPFGGGRRGCPGYTFVLATVEIAFARLLKHFDWELPRGVGVDNVDLGETFVLATRKRVPLVLVPTVNRDYEFKGSATLWKQVYP
ncbi:tryptamine 5-hydroxylase-like [Magnolia sinica]|uniref:tryptamine 5-hydroxylase-like n=1 Tax=Magnolia sinica TaxID=86752 RepID=UPI00265A5D19|nr:tryptamine 5-hydroxylase-like [Magnolia sinica]